MPAVRRTVQLAYTMGHTAGSGAALRNDEIAAHARRLAGELHELRRDDTEATGLLALILLTEARAGTRLTADGTQVLLADADRRQWDAALLAEGLDLVASLRSVLPDRPDRADPAGQKNSQKAGPLALQAAIAAEHGRATSFADTDWRRIVGWYDALLTIEPSPTIAIGRCVALSFHLGPEAGLADIDDVLALGLVDGYPYAHAARAQVLHRLGRFAEAKASWSTAASCARTDAERTFFTARA